MISIEIVEPDPPPHLDPEIILRSTEGHGSWFLTETEARQLAAQLTQTLRDLDLQRATDPCPACGRADLQPMGAKHRCPVCHYIQPCCNP